MSLETEEQLRDARAALCRETDQFLERIRVLEAALTFYADPFAWAKAHEPDMRVPDFYSEMDFGDRARLALTGGHS